MTKSVGTVTRTEGTPAPAPLVSEAIRISWEGDATEEKVSEFLARVVPAADANASSPDVRSALVPWVCDTLLSEHSVVGYGRDLAHFVRHMQALGVGPLEVTADHEI